MLPQPQTNAQVRVTGDGPAPVKKSKKRVQLLQEVYGGGSSSGVVHSHSQKVTVSPFSTSSLSAPSSSSSSLALSAGGAGVLLPPLSTDVANTNSSSVKAALSLPWDLQGASSSLLRSWNVLDHDIEREKRGERNNYYYGYDDVFGGNANRVIANKLNKINRKYNSNALLSSAPIPQPLSFYYPKTNNAVGDNNNDGSNTDDSQSAATLMKTQMLKTLSHENVIAATRIQRFVRGYLTRKRLWKYGGVLMVACVRKIQRVWRGYKGRLIAFKVLKEKLDYSANMIIRLFYVWWYRRFRKMLREGIAV
jgi:hypothetical protein